MKNTRKIVLVATLIASATLFNLATTSQARFSDRDEYGGGDGSNGKIFGTGPLNGPRPIQIPGR